MTKKILAIAALTLLLVGCTTGEDSSDMSEQDLNDLGLSLGESVEPEELLTSEEDSEFISRDVVGSCNSIDAHSACIDYIGSFWTQQIITLGCSSEEGMTFSKDACPTGSVGGCRIGGGNDNEMITWFYPFGGEPTEAETVQYAAAACNASLGASWVGAN